MGMYDKSDAWKAKPFDRKATCPKCGGIAVDAQYLPPCKAFMADPAKPERIERRCQRCRYAWHEAPLDSVKAVAPQPEAKVERLWWYSTLRSYPERAGLVNDFYARDVSGFPLSREHGTTDADWHKSNGFRPVAVVDANAPHAMQTYGGDKMSGPDDAYNAAAMAPKALDLMLPLVFRTMADALAIDWRKLLEGK